jgi:hypothetical protein
MDFPVSLDALANSNVERFRAEAAQRRLVSAALRRRPSRVPSLSLGRRVQAMVAGSIRALREPGSLTPRPRINA